MGRVIVIVASVAAAGVFTMVATVSGIVTTIAGNPTTTGARCAITVSSATGGHPAGLSADQTRNARTIIAVGRGMRVHRYGWVVAIATALQESHLTNLGDLGASNDHDSLGLFQQRPSAGWGTPRQVTTPTYAAHAFYAHLLRVPGWQRMPVTVAAQAVQQSAYPDAYAAHERQARAIVAALSGTPAADCDTPTVAAGGWVRPAPGPITSGYRTPDRPDHNGTDIAPPRGTTIRAASAGTVAVARCDPDTGTCDRDGSAATPGCGWYVEVRHPGNITSRYCHMQHRPAVRVGQRVTAGQPLGVVGMSGNADGPHLHYEIHTGYPATPANATDPAAFMRAHHAPL